MRNALEWVVVIVGALLVAWFVRSTLVQTFSIPSESMVPTLEIGDRVIVNKLDADDPERGDVMVFERPEALTTDLDHLIKRVIGLPGETVSASDGRVHIDGVPLDEPWLPAGVGTEDFGPVTVGEGELFMMGDNRSRSQDSRFFGPIRADSVVGTAVLRIWPISRLGGI